jgi:AraC family transcriptional regulator
MARPELNVLYESSGVIVRRVVDRSYADVPEHTHDWPVLSVFALGGYLNRTEVGEFWIDGPSAVLYRAGAAHRNTASSVGFEQIEIEFDPRLLGQAGAFAMPVCHWIGGTAGVLAQGFIRYCADKMSTTGIRAAMLQFLNTQADCARHSVPWVESISERLRQDPSVRVHELAREMERHPSWLGSVYKAVTGEGLLATAARVRVERASRLLRETDDSYASIALEAGFCDQSHMNRSFRRIIGRLPTAVRRDRDCLRQSSLAIASPRRALGESSL